MATGIDPSTVELRAVVSRAVHPGWVWSRQGHEVWMLDIDSSGLPCTRAVDIQTLDERIVVDTWGWFSPSRRFALSPGATPDVTRVYDLATSQTWDLAQLGSRMVPNLTESHVAAVVRPPGAQPPFTNPADVVVAQIDGAERRIVGRVLGGIGGWRADGALLVIGRDNMESASSLRVIGLDGELRSEWPLGQRVRTADVSPDGTHMTFAVVLDEGYRNGLFVIDLFTGHQRRLPSRINARWMPDVSGLLAVALRRPAGQPFRIWRLAFPRLYLEGALTDPERHDVDMESMDWQVSPSGTALAFRSARDAHLHVVTWERGDPR